VGHVGCVGEMRTTLQNFSWKTWREQTTWKS